MSYYVYIILCQGGSYYTGYTQDLKTRLEQHSRGRGSRYTRMKKPKRVVYMEWFKTRSEAMRRERAIKRLSHAEKNGLIREKQGAPENDQNREG